MYWGAVEWLVIVDDACEVGHACLAFPCGFAVEALGAVLVVGEAAFLYVFYAVVSPDVGFSAFWAWCGEIDIRLE